MHKQQPTTPTPQKPPIGTQSKAYNPKNRGPITTTMQQHNKTKPKPSPYAELHCISNYSFLRGASHPEELVKQASALGYRAIAMTDECSVAGVVKAHVAAKEVGIKLIVGSEFHFDEDVHLIVLAPNRD